MTVKPTDEQLAEWETLIEKLNVDEYNQAVPKNAPWRAQPGPCHNYWTVYQPIAPSGDYRVIADELREPFATFIAAARSAVPALVRALRDARDEVERLTHLGAVHHADVGEWRAERDTWRDRALQTEAERDGWRREAITRRRTLVNVARGLHLRAGRIQTELNEARAADHDHKLLADEWWRKCVAAEHCLAELAKSAACLDTVDGILGARLVCIRPSGHTGEHASVAGARWSLAAPTGQEATSG